MYSPPNPRFPTLNAKNTRSQHEPVFLNLHSDKGICYTSDFATNCSTKRKIDHDFGRKSRNVKKLISWRMHKGGEYIIMHNSAKIGSNLAIKV